MIWSKKRDQLVLIWDQSSHKISELEYKYDVNTENSYSRKWSFQYLAKLEYNSLENGYKNQNIIAQQAIFIV